MKPVLSTGLGRWTLRQRVLALSAAGVLVAFAVGLAAFAATLQTILTQNAQAAASTQAAQIAAVIEAGEYTPGDAVQALPARGSLLQVLDSSTGQVMASSDPQVDSQALSAAHPPPGSESVSQLDGVGGQSDPFLVVARGVQPPGATAVTLVVAYPLDAEERTVHVATVLLGGSALVLGLAVLILIARVLTAALSPVRRITAEVESISRSGAMERVTVPPARDEIATLARTMNDMLDRLARSDAATRRFVSDASHELRSPLSTLQLHVETAPANSDGTATVDRALVVAEVDRMAGLVGDLLTLAKADDRGLTIRQDEVDLDDVVDTEVRRLRAIAPGQVRARVVPAQVTGDAERLAQVLRNLTDNALRHTTDWIAVTMETAPGLVNIRVDNAGDPIPAEHRASVFERFTRLDDARDRDAGGSGLGLPIAAVLARAHGGDVTTGSTPDGNCRFTVTLPLRGDSSDVDVLPPPVSGSSRPW